MATDVYNNPAQYQGKEWTDLLRAMNPREIKKTLKTAYRRVGNQIANVARVSLASSGLRHGAQMKRSVRVRVYPRGGGFMVTVKPHGKQGYYKRSQDGKEKPVVMWASEGTKGRFLRHSWRSHPTGSMPAYNFLDEADKRGNSIVETQLTKEIEMAAQQRLEKYGWE